MFEYTSRLEIEHRHCRSQRGFLNMDAFISRKRRRISASEPEPTTIQTPEDEEDSTDLKLALLASLHPDLSQELLLDALLASEGSVEQASAFLTGNPSTPSLKRKAGPSRIGYQSSISAYRIASPNSTTSASTKRVLPKRGQTRHLYSPEDIETHTPCSIIHNFLPTTEADALLRELLVEEPTYQSLEFQLFERTVKSPHTFAFYVNDMAEVQHQKTEYIYDGQRVQDVRPSTPLMLAAGPKVQEAVNAEIQRRIRDFYPGAKKLRYQDPGTWKPNTAFVNCYTGPRESVGWHADQLTYIGPRAVIGSLSLGVAREFRVRRILPSSSSNLQKGDSTLADAQAQISIHLPHNSLLIMHAEMQEEWKHSISPAQTIDPHPISGNKRLNITYRYYKASLHPKYTPKCRCGVPCVLRCVMRKAENRGRYMWMCHAGYVPGKEGCSFFEWAEFDDDGEPVWKKGDWVKEEGTVGSDTMRESQAQRAEDDAANSRSGEGSI